MPGNSQTLGQGRDEVSELDLSGEEPTPAADPVITIEQLPEKAELIFELHGWKPRIRLQYSVEGPTGWAPLYFALVLLIAPASAVLITSQLLPPGATGTTVAMAAAGTGGAVFLGGAVLLFFLPLLRKH